MSWALVKSLRYLDIYQFRFEDHLRHLWFETTVIFKGAALSI